MAIEEPSLFDIEFALNQFSGNRALLVKMLGRFCEQQTSFPEKLATYKKTNEQDLAKSEVHGLKGVSGNLGMKSLHLACREFEDVLRQNTIAEVDNSSLINIMNATLEQVRLFIGGGDIDEAPTTQGDAPTAVVDTDTAARQELLKALNRNEFISNNKLSSLISDLSMSEDKIQQLQTAIDDLDYDKAVSLLK